MFEFLGATASSMGPVRPRTSSARLRVPFSKTAAFPTPLIAYDLPWATISIARARKIYDFLDGLGIATAGLRSEFTESIDEADGAALSDKAMPLDLEVPPPPVCPYRPERYGLDLIDVREARIIDLRLFALRDEMGLARYSPEMMRRWDCRAAKMADHDVMAYGGMNATHWPPDVSAKPNLARKIQQLRCLNERALISISMEACWIEENLEWIIDSGADIVTLMAADWPEDRARELAQLVVRTVDRLPELQAKTSALAQNASALETVKLMVVPPSVVSALDVVKLLALGANMVAVDGWCREFLQVRRQGISASDWAAVNLGVRSDGLASDEDTLELAPLESRLALLRETLESLDVTDVGELNRGHLIDYAGNTSASWLR